MNDKHCEACGQKLVKYDVSVSEGIIRALIKFRQAVGIKQENSIHLLNDMTGTIKLTPHEWNNFSRLRFHALVAKTGDSGFWLLTHRGAQFLRGEVDIPKKVQVFNNRVVSHSQDRVFIKDVIGNEPYFETIEDIHYEEASEEDVEKSRLIERKKRGKKYCPKCDSQMKASIREAWNKAKDSVIDLKKIYVCTNLSCGFEEEKAKL